MDEKLPKNNTYLVVALLVCSLIVISNSFYSYYLKKDFEYIVETSCDPSMEVCFQRDCSDPENCPPNGLSEFKRHTVNAGDFALCENEDCTLACENGAIECAPIECEEDVLMGETCTSLEASTEIE